MLKLNLIAGMSDCSMSVRACLFFFKHGYTQYNFFSVEICSSQRGLADSYHPMSDRSLLKSTQNNKWRPKLVHSSCGGWGLGGWQGSCCMQSEVRRRTRDTWTTLALGGGGLAVGVVTEVGFTEEPWAAFSSAGCEGHALQYWGRRGREKKTHHTWDTASLRRETLDHLHISLKRP